MEKLNIRIYFAIFATVGVLGASFAEAGSPFRIHTEAPAREAKRYVFGYGGVMFGSSYETTGFFDYHPNAIPISWDTDEGWAAGGGFGFYSQALGGSRFELEGSYAQNTFDTFQYDGFEGYITGGENQINTSSVMVNFLKEVPLGGVVGYFGAGVGGAVSEFQGDLFGVGVDSRQGGFAWQLIAGIDIPLNERLAFFTQYRYRSIEGIEYTTFFGDFTFSADDALANHSILTGLRFSF